MKTKIHEEREVEIKTLVVEARVRYWEDSTVNDVEDKDGNLIPFRQGDIWNPVIDVDSGVIKDWPNGITADIHYKVCDSGSYYMNDENGETVLSIEQDYVPGIMCPEGNGFGDYIIMKVNGDGKIANWKKDISGF